MGIGSSPKEVVKAIGDGYFMMTVTTLKPWGTAEKLHLLLQEIMILERTFRIFPEDDYDGNRKKHFRLGNLRKARMVIESFAKSRRIQM